MLETLRKHHYVLMSVIAAVVIVSFTFLYNPNQRMGSGTRIGNIYGRDFTAGEKKAIDEMGAVAGRLGGMIEGNDYMARFSDPSQKFINTLSSISNRYTSTNRNSGDDLDFSYNVMVMREEAKRLGIAADREDVSRMVQELGAFKSNGRFDSSKYDAFLSNGNLGDKTTTEQKLFTLAHDIIIFQKLSKLVGGSFAPSPAEVDDYYATQHVKTTAFTALAEKTKFAEQAVTDEEIKAFYDAEKAKSEAAPKEGEPAPSPDAVVLSDEKRSVKFVFSAKPKPPTAPVAPVQEDLSKITDEAQKKAKEEEFKKLQETYTKALDDHTKAMETHLAAEKSWVAKVDALATALFADDRGPKPFEEAAKGAGFEATQADFTKAAPPEALKAQAAALEAMFTAEPGPADPVQTADGWCLFEIASITKAGILPLDQVKEKITAKLKETKVAAALKDAATKARTAIDEALKAGKSFAEATTAAGLTAGEIPVFSGTKPPTGLANQKIVLAKCSELNAGETSEPQEVPEGLLLIHVAKKELPKDPKMEEDKKNLAKNLTAGDNGSPFSPPSPVFQAWFSSRRDAAVEVR